MKYLVIISTHDFKKGLGYENPFMHSFCMETEEKAKAIINKIKEEYHPNEFQREISATLYEVNKEIQLED